MQIGACLIDMPGQHTAAFMPQRMLHADAARLQANPHTPRIPSRPTGLLASKHYI
jgi:hypothetical protein